MAARDYLMIIAFINSVILTVASVASLVILSAMVAYIWQRRVSRFSPLINILVLAGLIVPGADLLPGHLPGAALGHHDRDHWVGLQRLPEPRWTSCPAPRTPPCQLTLLNFSSQFTTQYNLLFATILLVTIPPLIMFIFFNRKIVEGMAAGSVKG